MMLNIKYFGLLVEITGCTEETIEFSNTSVSELLDILFSKYPELLNVEFKVAHNQEIVTKQSKITNLEIALLPPFSGG